jgi:carnitine 3-dehydrogenase
MRVRVETQLLDGTGKRLHLVSRMYDDAGRLLATAEQMLLHVSLETRRTAPPGPAVQRKLAEVQAKQSALPRPARIRCGLRD